MTEPHDDSITSSSADATAAAAGTDADVIEAYSAR